MTQSSCRTKAACSQTDAALPSTSMQRGKALLPPIGTIAPNVQTEAPLHGAEASRRQTARLFRPSESPFSETEAPRGRPPAQCHCVILQKPLFSTFSPTVASSLRLDATGFPATGRALHNFSATKFLRMEKPIERR